jgi:hypothetical protein
MCSAGLDPARAYLGPSVALSALSVSIYARSEELIVLRFPDDDGVFTILLCGVSAVCDASFGGLSAFNNCAS